MYICAYNEDITGETVKIFRLLYAHMYIMEVILEAMSIGKLKDVAEAEGKTVRQMVIDAVKKRGSILGAAKELDVSPTTIRYHLEQAGMKLTVKTIVTVEKAS